MKIWIAQINTVAGNVEKNVKKIEDVIENFWEKADVLVFPELAMTGNPLYDMNNNEAFVNKQMLLLESIKETVNKIKKELIVVVWFIDMQWNGEKEFSNSAAIIGNDIKIYHKRQLENKWVKNEPRYFVPWEDDVLFKFGGEYTWLVTIWKDLEDEQVLQKDADVVFNLTSRCFEWGSRSEELKKLVEIQKRLWFTLVQVNQVGSECWITFDGWSKIISKDGRLINNPKKFEEVVDIVDVENCNEDYSHNYQDVESKEDTLQALKLWLKDYLEKRNIKDVVIGISWGMDSALDLAIMAQVISPDHIHAIYMPTKFNAQESLSLSQQLADNLWVELKVGPIQDLVISYEKFAEQYLWKKLEWVSHENVQARIRWNILMNLWNDFNAMIVNNSNKTELELWYWTLYGDLIGGLCLIWDLKKTEVYELAKYINKDKEIIPWWIITRKASAELSEWQVDPFNYDRDCDPVDDLASGYSIEEVAEKYQLPKEYLESLQKRITRSRFKAAQLPPILKVSAHTIRQWTQNPF